jgi:hypothetical protein
MHTVIVSDVDGPVLRDFQFTGASKRNTSKAEIENAADTLRVNNKCISQFVSRMFSGLVVFYLHV